MSDADQLLASFDTLVANDFPADRPKGGTTYLFKWSREDKKNDWRADGYRWRQGGSMKMKTAAAECQKKCQRAAPSPVADVNVDVNADALQADEDNVAGLPVLLYRRLQNEPAEIVASAVIFATHASKKTRRPANRR